MMLQVAFAMEEAYSALTALAEARQRVADCEASHRQTSLEADSTGDQSVLTTVLSNLELARAKESAARTQIDLITEPVRNSH